MKRRFLLIAIACVTVVVIATGFALWPESQPAYDGKSLEQWLMVSVKAGGPRDPRPDADAARAAVSRIGTNALPWLTKWISYQPPAWKVRTFFSLGKRWPNGAAAFRRIFMDDSRLGASRAQLAQRGFIILGEQSLSSMPTLIARAAEGLHPGAAMLLQPVLQSLGQAALPALAGSLTNQTLPLLARRRVCLMMSSLSYGATNADMLLPSLIHSLDDPEMAGPVMEMLEGFKRHPPLALPVLEDCLAHTNALVRSRAALSLAYFGTNARPATPLLERATNDSDLTVRQAATATLRFMNFQYPPGPGN